jgi:hypothetical protein
MNRAALPLRLGVIVCLMCSSFAAAQTDPPIFPDPLRFSSLPLEATEATAVPAGEWRIGATVGYFNVWQVTWHTSRIQQEFGLGRAPLEAWELRLLEQRHPGDQFYHVDLEGTRTDLVVQRGLASGITVTVRVPLIEIGAPNWDAIAERFHHTLGLSQANRNMFPRGQTSLYIRGRSGAIEAWDELERSGIGDVSVALSGSAGSWLSAAQRWVVAVEAPTGRRDTLLGSGGWDLGARWFATWGDPRRPVRLGLGFTRLDPNGSFLGVKRSNTWHVALDHHRPLGASLDLRVMARFDSSPLARFTDSDLGKPSFYWTVGLVRPIGRSAWVAFDLGENLPSKAEVPDYSLHLSVGTRLAAPR